MDNSQLRTTVVLATVYSCKYDELSIEDKENQEIIKSYQYDVYSEERASFFDKLIAKPEVLSTKQQYNSSRLDFENREFFTLPPDIDNYSKTQLILIKYSLEQRLGCDHYSVGCSLQCKSCTLFYKCRFCHDQTEQHDCVPSGVVKCSYCSTIQPFSNTCIACGKIFGQQFCRICQIISDLSPEARPMLHCELCGVCICGTRSTTIHCEKCSQCVSSIVPHNCAATTDSICPVCYGALQSLSQIISPRCGHYLHEHCYEALVERRDFGCPLCRRCVVLPAEFDTVKLNLMTRHRRSIISPSAMNLSVRCQDCSSVFVAVSHPLCYFCPACGGFNVAEVGPTAEAETAGQVAVNGHSPEGVSSALHNLYGNELELIGKADGERLKAMLQRGEIIRLVAEVLNKPTVPGSLEEFLGGIGLQLKEKVNTIEEFEENEFEEGSEPTGSKEEGDSK